MVDICQKWLGGWSHFGSPRIYARGEGSGLRFFRGSKMAPQAGQIIFSKSALLISFGLITLPHFVQVVFSVVSTLSQSIFLAIAELSTFARR